MIAGGTRFTPASSRFVKLTPACSLEAPSQPNTPAATPPSRSTTTATARRPPSHDDRETGPATMWSSLSSDSSERAMVTWPAATKASSTASIRKHTPRTASAPFPVTPSLVNTSFTEDPEIVALADLAMRP